MASHYDLGDITTSRRLRLETLIRLRWLAVAGQSITVIVIAFWLEFPLPLLPACVLIALLAAVNFYLAVRYPPAHRLMPEAAQSRRELERRALRLFGDRGLPPPRVNSLVEGVEVDLLWPAARLVVELDSRAFHTGENWACARAPCANRCRASAQAPVRLAM